MVSLRDVEGFTLNLYDSVLQCGFQILRAVIIPGAAGSKSRVLMKCVCNKLNLSSHALQFNKIRPFCNFIYIIYIIHPFNYISITEKINKYTAQKRYKKLPLALLLSFNTAQVYCVVIALFTVKSAI